MITTTILEKITGKKANANLISLVVGLDAYPAGLDKPHRAAQFLAQVLHENGGGRYDKEVWGPTPAQKRYDTRTDLGNTAAVDGDGKKYMGRSGMQITGKANYAAFRDWCRENVSAKAPDFVANPDAVNTDPWEGLGPVWYWDTRKLNALADKGDLKAITKKINGGYNGLADRERWYGLAALVLLGYSVNGAKAFQTEHGLKADGVIGPVTRAAMHEALLLITAKVQPPADHVPTKAAPSESWLVAFIRAILALFKGMK